MAKKVAKKIEYWSRQIMIDGEIVTGEVKPADKKRFLELCKANGVDIDERNWFKQDNWQDRVFKRAKVNKK